MTSADSTEPTDGQSVPRWEWVTLIAIVVLAAGLRFCLPGRLAVEHFDEGVYASNIWFGDRPELTYPLQHLYAPPLLPALIEWGYVFFGPSNAGAMWPSQLAGTITVLLLWRLGRSWFGPVAGLTAASLCALSDVHLVLSRAALTDVLLGMWWVAALLALRKACASGRWSHSAWAGILVGVAWYTKYNGWMPLAITIAAVVARGICCKGVWPQTRRALASCLIAGVVAFAVWSPWLWSLQSKGGYSSVMANHRQYVVGFGGWWSSFTRQISQLEALSRFGTVVAIAAPYLALSAVVARRTKMSGEGTLAQSPTNPSSPITPSNWLVHLVGYEVWSFTMIGVFFSGLTPVLGLLWLATQALVFRFIRGWVQPTSSETARPHDLGLWILAAWFAGLAVATPLYRPYLRLTLPWLLAMFCVIGMGFDLAWRNRLLALAPPGSIARWRRKTVIVTTAVVVLTIGSGLSQFFPSSQRTLPVRTSPLSDQSGIVEVSRQIAGRVIGNQSLESGDSQQHVVYVYAEPGLLFQLRQQGLPYVGPVSDLKFVSQQSSSPAAKIYLVVGIHAKSDPRFAEQFASASANLKRVDSWEWQLGPLVALDQAQCNPAQLGTNPSDTSSIELYEVVRP